jgi:hypothetical protein
MADFLSIPHDESTLVIEPPGPSALFADRDHFLWTDELVATYLRTRRVMWQGQIWERSGVCNRCGACCRWDEPVRFSLWAASFVTMEQQGEEGKWPQYISVFQPDWVDLFWCRYLKHPGKPVIGHKPLPPRDYYCNIWARHGFSALPAICQVEPCTPRHDQNPTWFERHPMCPLQFEDVTRVYIPE